MRIPKDDDDLRTQWTLIRKVCREDFDEDSWNELYNLYNRVIIGLAIKKYGLNRQAAEEVAHEILTAVYTNIRDFVPDPKHGSFRSWLFKIARWRILDYIRKHSAQARSSSVPSDDDSQRTATVERIADPASLELDQTWEQQWKDELRDLAIKFAQKEVSANTFQIFDFSRQGMPVSKIARSLGVSVGAIYMARFHMKRHIAKEFKLLKAKMK